MRVADVIRDAHGRAVGVRMLDEHGRAGGELRAPIVVAADGLRSVVARRLGLARTYRWPRRLALVTHYERVRDVGEHTEMHVERDGYVGIADVGNGLTTVALVVPASRSRELSGDREAIRRSMAAVARASRATIRWRRAHDAGRRHGTLRVARAPSLGPGAALVGDAADFFDPFTGEGIYAALRGGEMLASRLVDAVPGDAPRIDAALGEYDAERRREFGGKWIVERVIGAVVGAAQAHHSRRVTAAQRKDLADLLIGVTGDFVPAREIVRLGYVWSVFGWTP